MEERLEWMRNLFEALSSNSLSRNKHYHALSGGWARSVHKRARTVFALKHEARRLQHLPDAQCWVSSGEDGLRFHMRCPGMNYQRIVAVYGYELDWLMRQDEVRRLLTTSTLEPSPASG